MTVPLFGGRRAVLVKAGSRNIAAALEPVLASPSSDCRVIIEAGDLSKSAPLRALCEKAKVAAALPCYADNARDLARLIDDEMRAANLVDRARRARRAWRRCSAATGWPRATRSASSRSMRKAKGASSSPTSWRWCRMPRSWRSTACSMPPSPDRTRDVETEFAKARAGGSSPAAILSAAIRHVANLHKMRLAIDGGDSAEFAMKRGAPPIHFTREKLVGEALRAWSAPRLLRAMAQLAEASLEARRNAPLAETIAQRTLLALAMSARRREAA